MSRSGAHRSASPYGSSSRGAGFFVRLTALVVALLVVLAGVFVGVQLSRGTPEASATVVAHGVLTAPGSRPSLPTPTHGATYVQVEGLGTIASHNAGEELPLASITKLVTALVVLHHHPLSPGQQGPEITVTSAVGAAYPGEAAVHDSVIPVRTGERLSEYQCLEALLVPSADNIADLLATWTAGSTSAFVAEMNAEAASLGLHHTHFVDPSGLDAASQGTARDLVRLGKVVLSQPLLAHLVALPQVDLPLAGVVYNFNYVLGRDGIIGIKTGSTLYAGGDFLWAARRKVGGHTVTVVGAVLDQQGKVPIQAALHAAERLSVAAFDSLHQVTLLPSGRTLVRVTTPWGASTRAITTRAVSAFGYPGEQVSASVHMDGTAAGGRLRTPLAAGTRLATLEVQLPSGTVSVPATTVTEVAGPSISWKLERL